jgi:hypothetical protein
MGNFDIRLGKNCVLASGLLLRKGCPGIFESLETPGGVQKT